MKIGLMYITPEKNLTGINRLIKGTVTEVLNVDEQNIYVSIDDNYLNFPVKEPFKLDFKFNHSQRPFGAFQLSYEMTKLFDMRAYCSGGMDLLHSYFRPFTTLQMLCPKILTMYDLIPSIHPEWAEGKEFYDTLLKPSAQEADKVIAISEYTKEDLVHYYNIPAEKIKVIYPGLESKLNFEQVDMSLLSIYPISEGYLLSVCSLAPHKNLPGVIKGFAAFKEMYPGNPIKLLLVGQPIPNNNLEQYLEKYKGVKNDIVMTGYVEDSVLSALYKYSLGVIYASLYEGFGLPILEAMAAGKAVISSDVTSMPEVGGDAVIYCDPYNIESIANAINILVTDSARRKECEEKGIARAKLFSYKKAALETVELYREFL